MFAQACAFYEPLACILSYGANHQNSQVSGAGTLISDTHILTARHVVRNPSGNRTTFAMKFDGTFATSLVWEDASLDLAIIQVGTCLEQIALPAPTGFPTLPTTPLQRGEALGYFARLRVPAIAATAYFGAGYYSMLIQGTPPKGPRMMLSDGMIQSGFSGAGVFTPDKLLQGVIVEAYQFPVDTNHTEKALYTKPVMSYLGTVLSSIRRVTGR
jgi:hypothetical protein